ncbi:helix-turn-helix transcriptional regulator [Streptomyces sp. R302]|nr:helix-turn-helix transcriptional regulator [Streptomyces sp. R301]NML82196.1 helix-turn-helix transcriptional regulator [Streptomyces sp. R302]
MLSLELLGLSTVQEAVYRSLLTGSPEGVEALAARLGVGESQVRDALDRLVDLELLRPSRDTPGMLRAVSPETGFESILRRQEAELLRRQEELLRSRETVARAVAAYAAERPAALDDAERLIGLDAIQNRLESLARDLTEECCSIEPGGAQSQASLDAARPLDERALARGVALRTIYQDSARNDAATFGYARWHTEQGGQIRTCPETPPRMLIFDRRIAVVPIDPANTRLGALCTASPGIVAPLLALFEQTWEMAVPLGADHRAGTPASDGLSPVERSLLKLLASGMTDEAAAKRLGVSLRTVRRQMAALMERLNATSRFEAGLKAAKHGWLT